MPWTIETLKEHYDTLLAERAARAEERHEAAQRSIAAALAAATQATNKAEEAFERRLQGVNEFRAQMADQQRTLMPRAETEGMVAALRERVDRLEKERVGATSERSGAKAGYAWAIGVVSVLATIISAVIVIASRQ